MQDLIYDPVELDAARVIAVMVPGALSRIEIFHPAHRWRDEGYGLAFYRFPGLDGRPYFPPLSITGAAAEIVNLVSRYPDKPIRLLGYSTGGPIVLTAAAQMQRDVKVAAMSLAVEEGGGVRTGMAGLADVLGAAWRRGSLRRREVWLEYYRVLLFGRRVLGDAVLTAQADALIAGHLDRIVMPEGELPRAHTDDLRRWRLPEGFELPPQCVRFFVGLEDPVFTQEQTLELAHRLGGCAVTGYPDHGHLLFLSNKPVFQDVLAFFEGRAIGNPNSIEML